MNNFENELREDAIAHGDAITHEDVITDEEDEESLQPKQKRIQENQEETITPDLEMGITEQHTTEEVVVSGEEPTAGTSNYAVGDLIFLDNDD